MNNDPNNSANVNRSAIIFTLAEAGTAVLTPAGDYCVIRTVDMLDEECFWSTLGWGEPNVTHSDENGWMGTVLLDDGTTISVIDYSRYGHSSQKDPNVVHMI